MSCCDSACSCPDCNRRGLRGRAGPPGPTGATGPAGATTESGAALLVLLEGGEVVLPDGSTLVFAAGEPLDPALFSYNAETGVLTFLQDGLYTIALGANVVEVP